MNNRKRRLSKETHYGRRCLFKHVERGLERGTALVLKHDLKVVVCVFELVGASRGWLKRRRVCRLSGQLRLADRSMGHVVLVNEGEGLGKDDVRGVTHKCTGSASPFILATGGS